MNLMKFRNIISVMLMPVLAAAIVISPAYAKMTRLSPDNFDEIGFLPIILMRCMLWRPPAMSGRCMKPYIAV